MTNKLNQLFYWIKRIKKIFWELIKKILKWLMPIKHIYIYIYKPRPGLNLY